MANDNPHHKKYTTAQWKNLRTLVLARDPICMMLLPNGEVCNRPATVADHIKPHHGDHFLFSDLSNLRGVCKSCHDRKTATLDGGFGNAPSGPDGGPVTTGDAGQQFVSSSDASAIDAALERED